MSNEQNPINISSDSSDDEPVEQNRMPPPPYLRPYKPPRHGMRYKEQARKIKHDINARYLPWHRNYRAPQQAHPPQAPHPTAPQPPQASQPPHPPQASQPPSELANELPQALTEAFAKALASMTKEPVSLSQSSYQPSQPSHPKWPPFLNHPPSVPRRPEYRTKKEKEWLKTLAAHLAKLLAEPSPEEASTPTTAAPPLKVEPRDEEEGPSQPTESFEERGIVMGLACPRVWNIATQEMGRNRTMPSFDSLKDALESTSEEQARKDAKAKGKRPME